MGSYQCVGLESFNLNQGCEDPPTDEAPGLGGQIDLMS